MNLGEFFSGLSFAYPFMLLFLFVVPTYVLWYIAWYSPKRLTVSLSYNPGKLKKSKFGLRWLRYLPLTFQCLALFLLLLSLARPQTSFTLTTRNAEGIDIMLLLDTSFSMETTDLAPNRLDAAKSTAINFIKGRKDDRIGIVLFAEDAFSYAPRTLDYELLIDQVEDISPSIMPNTQTAMGSAIMIGILRMEESESPSKVMILLTDGVNTAGPIKPVPASRLAAEMGIKMYCIGVGDYYFSTPTELGTFKTPAQFDEKTLREIASTTGGQYFHAQDEAALDQVFGQISEMEKSKVEIQQQKLVNDLYPPLLIMALICLVIAFGAMALLFYNPLEE